MDPAGKKQKGKQRLRFGRLPIPAKRAELYWSCKQPELKGISDGQLAAMLIDSPEFQEIVLPKLEQIDRRNRTGWGNVRGRPSRWSALQLESVLVFRRVAGLESIKRVRERLHCEPESRLLLGLGDKLPSSATMTRYMRQHFDDAERAELYLRLDRQLRQRVVQLHGFDQEARILGMDGSQHGTHFTPPIPKVNAKGKTTGEIVNADKKSGEPGAITAPTAGYVGGYNPKSGQGWQLLGLWTEHGTLLAWDISALNESEKPAAERVLDAYREDILPHRQGETISVLTADGGFNSGKIREQAQSMRIVPNIHKASHKEVPGLPNEQTEEATKLDTTWRQFHHPGQPQYDNWQANGHGEIRCSCGNGKRKRVFEVNGKGLTMATKGQCSTCGTIRILAGKWHLNKAGRYVLGHRGDKTDPALGNPLTFNDRLSAAYGQDRFGWGESVHATLNRRFGLLKDKSWMRDITEVKTEFAIAASAISILLLERDQRQNGNGTESNAEPAAEPELDSDDAEMPAAA